jgi:hypothetical protein
MVKVRGAMHIKFAGLLIVLAGIFVRFGRTGTVISAILSLPR